MSGFMEAPERVTFAGVEYVRADLAHGDAWETLTRLCKAHGIDVHRAYEAVRAGELDARIPKGRKRGLKCRPSEFERWVADGVLIGWE